MFATVTWDTAVILGLLGLSAVQVTFGLFAGRFLWGRPRSQGSDRQVQQAVESLSQVHNMAGVLSAQAGQFAHELAAIQRELASDHKLDDQQLHSTLIGALAKIGDVNRHLQEQLQSAESRLEQQARQIESHMAEARTDALTGLHNRRAFDDELNRRVTDFQRKGDPASLMLVDVDHFKKFNDTYGHQAGDEVLRGVARVLYASVRDSDIVCRYGGEEFAVILPGQVGNDAQKSAERIRSAVERAVFAIDGQDLNVTISGGVAPITPRDTHESLLRRADEALYASKAAGRNCAHLHDGKKCAPLTSLEGRKSCDNTNHQSSTSPQLEYRNKQEEITEAETDSRTDPLTGLPNRRAFSEDLRRRVAQWRRFNTPLSLIVTDVDFLNVVNQTHGREMGDIVLRAVTQFLTTAVREMDVVARYHGDEFVLMLPGTALDNAIRAAERIRNAVGMCKLRTASGELTFTVSMGVAEASCDDDAISLVARATTALDLSKASGSNCTHVHNGHACQLIDNGGVAPSRVSG
jgi:diguanylate cyclase